MFFPCYLARTKPALQGHSEVRDEQGRLGFRVEGVRRTVQGFGMGLQAELQKPPITLKLKLELSNLKPNYTLDWKAKKHLHKLFEGNNK